MNRFQRRQQKRLSEPARQNQKSNRAGSLVSAFNDMEAREEKRRLEDVLSKQVGLDDTCTVSQTFLLKAPFVCDRSGDAPGSESEKISVDYLIRNSEPLYYNREEGIILYR